MNSLSWIILVTVIGFTVMIFVIVLVLIRWTGQIRVNPGFAIVQPMPAQQPSAATHIKKVNCRECGAQKLRPPETAFLYCDYCGALVDYDFRMAIAKGWHMRPGQVLRELLQFEQPLRAHAVQTGDFRTYEQSSRKLLMRHAAMCPEHYPPRIKDPAYLEAYLTFRMAVAWTTEHDPEHVRLKIACMQALQGVQYQYQPGQIPRAHTDSMRYFVGAAKAYLDRFFELAGTQLHLHPDKPSLETLRAFEGSKMVQNWLPMLGPDDQRWLISEMGFSDEYVAVQHVETQQRHCGWCAATLQVVHGGRRALCMGCGRYSDVATPEIACTSCGAQVSIPAGSRHFHCPHCRSEMHVHG